MTDLAYTDGNSIAGPLAEMFALDITGASTVCVGCRQRSSVAELRVYAAGPGSVARCPACGGVVLRYARTPTNAVVDLRGTFSLSIPC